MMCCLCVVCVLFVCECLCGVSVVLCRAFVCCLCGICVMFLWCFCSVM